MKIINSVLAVLLLLVSPGILHAQLPEKKALTLEAAEKVATAAEAEAEKRNATVVIVVVDDGGWRITTIDAKTIEPEEIRAKESRGGDSHVITKGDVVVIPNGTPHWFKEVKGPINYYVMKVRSAD
jgi:hypothetical protein